MLIKMLKTTSGSTDGIRIQEFEAGQEYDLNNDLVRAFCDQMRVAVRIEKPIETILDEIESEPEVEKPKEPEKKMVYNSPSNKAIDTSPINKRRKGRLSGI